MVGVQSGGGLPQGCECQVGAAERQVRGGRRATSGQTGGVGCVEEAEGAALRGFHDELAPCSSPAAVCRGVPGLVVGIKVTHHQGVASEVSLEEVGELGRVVTRAGVDGGDVDVNDCQLDMVYCHIDALVLCGGVIGE